MNIFDIYKDFEIGGGDDFESDDEVLSMFEASQEDKDFVYKVLYARYTYGNWEGHAHVVFLGIDGKFYEVFGSHCSCYGLEGQWDIEETSLDYYQDLWDRGVGDSKSLIIRGILSLSRDVQ